MTVTYDKNDLESLERDAKRGGLLMHWVLCSRLAGRWVPYAAKPVTCLECINEERQINSKRWRQA